MRFRAWHLPKKDLHSESWHLVVEFWRLKLHPVLIRHNYPTSPDRWVFQTSTIYDRKDSAS